MSEKDKGQGKVSESVKQYLKRAFFTNQKINDSLYELETLRAKAVSIGAVDTTKDKIQIDRVADIIGDNVSAIVDLESEINAEIERFKEQRREILDSIERVNDDRLISILRKRYICFKSWEEIAVDLSYSYVHTIRLHGEALQAFEKIYDVECYRECVI